MKTQEPVTRYMSASPHTIGAEQTLDVASRLMREHHVRHLPVLRGGQLVGIISERDVSLISGLPKVDPSALEVSDAMSEELFTVAPETPLGEVAATMALHKYGAALVVDGRQRLLGIFTTVDALQALADGAPVAARH